MNNCTLTHFEWAIEAAKLAVICIVIVFNIISLAKAEKRIARFYSCPFKARLIKGAAKETGIFDNRNNIIISISVWTILALVLIYWTASKINIVPVPADLSILLVLIGFGCKDIRTSLCILKSIQRSLQIRESDKCTHSNFR